MQEVIDADDGLSVLWFPSWNNLQGIEILLSPLWNLFSFVIPGSNVSRSRYSFYITLICALDADPTRPYDTCDAVHRAHVNYPGKIYDASWAARILPCLEILGRVYSSVISVEIRKKKKSPWLDLDKIILENRNLSCSTHPYHIDRLSTILSLSLFHIYSHDSISRYVSHHSKISRHLPNL